MTLSDKWGEGVTYVKLGLVWAANYFTWTNANAVLSTIVLLATLVYTGLQIDKLLREREVAIRAAREAHEALVRAAKEKQDE